MQNLISYGSTGFIIAIAGSPRMGGNTDLVLEYAKEIANRNGFAFQIIQLRDFDIKRCGYCGECNTRSQPCAAMDDVSWIIERMVLADGIIYAAPVYGFGMSHLMQTFIERSGVGYLRFERPLRNKVGAAIVTGRRYNHLHVYNQLHLNFMLNRLIVAGAGFPCVLHGGRPGKALDDEEGMQAVDATVMRMIEMVSILRNTSLDGASRNRRNASLGEAYIRYTNEGSDSHASKH